MPTVSDFVIQRVRQWGVTRVFGFPGDGVGELDGAHPSNMGLRRPDARILDGGFKQVAKWVLTP